MKCIRLILQSGPGFPQRQATNFIQLEKILSHQLAKTEMYKNLLLEFFYDHTCVMDTKTKSVAECSADHSLLRFSECEIQPGIQFRIIGEMIYCRGHNVFPHTHDAGDGLNHSGCSQAMTGH